MKKTTFILSFFLSITTFTYSQVGVGTTTPAATTDIVAVNPTGVTTNVDGILIPRVDRQRAQSMTAIPNATMIYVSSIATGAATGQASNITSTGFYSFDTSLLPAPGKWIKFQTGSTDWALTGNTGTTAGTNYVGTTDVQDLRFRTNNTDRLNISNATGQVQSYYAGTDALPAFSWNSDPDTGVLHPATDNLSITTGGVERIKSSNSETVVNDLSNNYDFRIETDNRTNALFADASSDAVIFGSAGNLAADGSTFTTFVSPYSTTVDYVADFDNGASRGTTMGLGSIEYLVDGEAELFVSDTFSPNSHLTYDLGYSMAWDDIYADDFWNYSDIRAKKDIKPMQYGLKELMQLNTISYKLIDDPFQDKKIGLIAQEVNKLVPEASKTEDYKKNEKGEFEKVQLDKIRVSYVNLVPVLIKAVQEQQELIKKLEARLKVLENK